MKKIVTILICTFISMFVFSQNIPKDTIYGNIKEIKEKVIFLTEEENPQLFYYDDYGHSGFMGPENTISKFQRSWFSFAGSYYINYHRIFDENRNLVKETWFGKKDDFLNGYRYIYDEKSRLISTIDSSNYSSHTRNHYFEEIGDYVNENIISEDLKTNYFNFNYKRYYKDKLVLRKHYESNSVVHEYVYDYNEHGDLANVTYKEPYISKKKDEGSWSFGVHDSLANKAYKHLVNQYNEENKLIKANYFEKAEHTNDIVKSHEMIYHYKDGNLIARIKNKIKGQDTYYYFSYDKSNRLTESYCCDEDMSKANLVQKYSYKNNRITELDYNENIYPYKKIKVFKILFTYKFDDKNNWVEIIKTVNGIKRYKWVREIAYFKP